MNPSASRCDGIRQWLSCLPEIRREPLVVNARAFDSRLSADVFVKLPSDIDYGADPYQTAVVGLVTAKGFNW